MIKCVVGKMVVLGHQGVGKTSLVLRYTENSYSPQISPTIGASYFSCKIPIGDAYVKLQIWDTAGQEKFRAITPMFYRNSNAAMVVFDITSLESFEKMKNWVLDLRRNISEALYICVVGNKIDLEPDRQVPRDEALHYAKSIGASYYECSALQDQGIDQVFEHTAIGLLRMLDDKSLETTLKIYSGDVDSLMARSTTLAATDVGKTETASWSINSIAHAENAKPGMCC